MIQAQCLVVDTASNFTEAPPWRSAESVEDSNDSNRVSLASAARHEFEDVAEM